MKQTIQVIALSILAVSAAALVIVLHMWFTHQQHQTELSKQFQAICIKAVNKEFDVYATFPSQYTPDELKTAHLQQSQARLVCIENYPA